MATRLAIVQMIIFQALCLGLVASLFRLFGGYVLSLSFSIHPPTYLTKAFTLGTNTKIGPKPVLLALGGGLLAACLASMVPLGDLLRGRPVDGAFQDSHTNTRGPIGAKGWLATATVCLVLLASALFLYVPSAAILACVSLAVATMLAVPLALATLLRVAETLARRYQNLTVLPLALSSLKSDYVALLGPSGYGRSCAVWERRLGSRLVTTSCGASTGTPITTFTAPTSGWSTQATIKQSTISLRRGRTCTHCTCLGRHQYSCLSGRTLRSLATGVFG